VEREPASSWYRVQVRQARNFGLRSVIWGTLALVWPLVLSLLTRDITATIVFYAIALVIDVVLFAIWLKRALEYSKRASRGETFSLRAPKRQNATRGIPVKH
jgi:hypothetical protein